MPAPGDVTGVILVGGKSSRMGRDKALLPLDGGPLFCKVLAKLRSTLRAVLLIGDRPGRFEGYGLPIFPDIHPGSALGGLYTGLSRAATPFVFAAACDLPFASPRVLRHLISLREGTDAVVPLNGEHPEPLFALYHKNCLEPMRTLLESGNHRIRDLYPRVRTRYVPREEIGGFEDYEKTFRNLNTIEEYEAVLGRKKRGG